MTARVESLTVGDELPVFSRAMTRERMRWYCDTLETTALGTGEFVIAEPTIHSDDKYARSQGLPGIIADGMISTNWISQSLYAAFRMDYLRAGELQTKYVRPIYEDETIDTHVKITDIERVAGRVTYEMEVWCATADGVLCTVGRARVTTSLD